MEENAPPVVARRHPEASYLFQASKAQSKWSATGCLLKMHDVSLVPKRKRSKLIENYGRNWTQHKFIAPYCTSVQLNGRGGRLRVFCMRPSALQRWLRKRCSWRWMSATRRLQTEWVSCEYRVSIELWIVVMLEHLLDSMSMTPTDPTWSYRRTILTVAHRRIASRFSMFLHELSPVLIAFQLCSIA